MMLEVDPPARARRDRSTPDLAELPRGFGDAVQASQASFRRLLDAMARPGRILALDSPTLAALQHPACVSPALAAVLLTLTDADTRVWLCESLAAPPELARLGAFGRFHTGMVWADQPEGCEFAFTRASGAPERLLSVLPAGSDDCPQDGATIVIDAPTLRSAHEDPHGRLHLHDTPDGSRHDEADPTPWVRLSGPGIEHAHALAVGGLSLAFWRARQALQDRFPRGVDVIVCCGDRLAAVPRSTAVVFMSTPLMKG